jgi:phosphoglucosamine mutase
VFWELGADVHTIHANPDGLNINHNCGSQFTRDLSEAVLKEKAHLGMAFDGDGDRLIAVDETGETITGDQIIAICAQSLKKDNRLKNNTVVTTVMSNKGLTKYFRETGIKHVQTNVGDRYVLEEMLKIDAVIGGEDSGHIIFLEHHTAGDGILTGLQLVASMLKEQKSLSELKKIVTIFPQMMINVKVKRKPELSTLTEVQDTVREAEEELGDDGRVLVRYSGTEQICRVMIEGEDRNMVGRYCEKISDAVKKTIG